MKSNCGLLFLGLNLFFCSPGQTVPLLFDTEFHDALSLAHAGVRQLHTTRARTPSASSWLIGFEQSRPFELAQIKDRSVQVWHVGERWAWGIRVGQRSSPIHRETRWSVSQQWTLAGEQFGVQYMRRSLAFDGYESANSHRISAAGSTHILPAVMAFCLVSKPLAQSRIDFELLCGAQLQVGDERFLGVQYEPSPVAPRWTVALRWGSPLILHLGHEFVTQTIGLGMTFQVSDWSLSWGMSNHSDLGWSRAWNMLYRIDRGKVSAVPSG